MVLSEVVRSESVMRTHIMDKTSKSLQDGMSQPVSKALAVLHFGNKAGGTQCGGRSVRPSATQEETRGPLPRLLTALLPLRNARIGSVVEHNSFLIIRVGPCEDTSNCHSVTRVVSKVGHPRRNVHELPRF